MEEFVMGHFVDEEQGEKLRFTPRQKEFIYREISYRVRENLNTIASIFGLQLLEAEAENDPSRIRLMQNSRFRINTFSLLQELCYPQTSSRKSYDSYLYEILAIVENATGMHTEADVDVTDLHLTQRQKILIGSIVAELYANTLEHLCREPAVQGACRVEITLSQDAGRHRFCYREAAVSSADTRDMAQEEKVGLKLVDLHVRALEGEIQRVFEEGGETFRIMF